MILKTSFFHFTAICGFALFCNGAGAQELSFNEQILKAISVMPEGGTYARYRKERVEAARFDDLYQTVEDLGKAVSTAPGGTRLAVKPEKAKNYSFCSSATYLVFCKVVGDLQKQGVVPKGKELSREIADFGDKTEVIQGRMDGIGIFGHWNADGPGTAVLFQRLGLGTNFVSYEKAKPGDFMKIFWNDKIGKGERGHSVVYLGASDDGNSIEVWSSQSKNEDGGAGYGTMWVAKSKIKRVLFSRLEHPENLARWLDFNQEQRKSDYLIRIRQTGSSAAEMKEITGAK